MPIESDGVVERFAADPLGGLAFGGHFPDAIGVAIADVGIAIGCDGDVVWVDEDSVLDDGGDFTFCVDANELIFWSTRDDPELSILVEGHATRRGQHGKFLGLASRGGHRPDALQFEVTDEDGSIG